jgi:hypothetical protein
MVPRWYVDLEVRSAEDDRTGSCRVLRGVALAQLHAVFVEYPGRFAVALALDSRQLRVFASSRDDLDILAGALEGRAWIRDYAMLSYPRMVPTDYSGRWWTYRRFRVPTERTDRRTGGDKGALRLRRLRYVEAAKLEYFKIRSGSNGNTFTVIVERVPGSPQLSECAPNGYGLASAKNLFSLPECE